MKIKIIGEPKEIAALVLAVQGRQNREVLAIGEISAKGHSNDLVTKTVRTGNSQRDLWFPDEHPLAE